jgi:hypothetical protein
MADSDTQELTDVVWRRLTRVVWVGRRDGRHLGMIERGHDYVATDGEGTVLGRYRDLAAAQAAFALVQPSAAAIEPTAPSAAARGLLWALVVVGGGIIVALGASAWAMLLQ